MTAFSPPFAPVALPDDVVKLLPSGELRRVKSVEPLGEIGPVNFGSIAAGGTASQNGRSVIEVTEVEMNKNHLGQYRIEPLSPVEVRVNQDNRRDARFENADQQGALRSVTPESVSEVFVLGDGTPFLELTNENPYDLDNSYVLFSGFKLILSTAALNQGEVDGQPKAVPVDKLEQRTQSGANGSNGGSAASATFGGGDD